MTEKERVISALMHQETDIIPYQLDLTAEVFSRLAVYFNDSNFYDKTGSHLISEVNESFTELAPGIVKDMYGVVWNREVQQGDFGVIKDYILKEPEFGDYSFPLPDGKLIREKCERLQKNNTKFKIYDLGFSLFERAWTLRSMEELLIDFKINKDFANQLFDKITEYNLGVVDIVAQYDIDCVLYGDDWGQQKGLIMGPDLWRQFIKPSLKVMYEKVKANGMYVGQHSCGDISEVFPDLVDMGLDIYNTFQPEIYDIELMKKLYGSNVTFYGGISTQRILPYGSVDELKNEMKRIMTVMGKNGGYIVAPTHAIPGDVPIENILAFLDVVHNQK